MFPEDGADLETLFLTLPKPQQSRQFSHNLTRGEVELDRSILIRSEAELELNQSCGFPMFYAELELDPEQEPVVFDLSEAKAFAFS